MAKISILASGDGSNFQALVEASRSGILNAEVAGLITNRPKAPALLRAENLKIPSATLSPKAFSQRDDWDRAVLKTLQEWKTDWVVLAGFLTLIGPRVLKAFPNRVVNIHPALLPNFGGEGMYGMRVHEAVLAAGALETGITLHLVSEEYDRGKNLAQFKIPVIKGESADALAARIRELEHRHYPRVLNDLVQGRLNSN